MTPAKQLADLRKQFDAGTLAESEFIAQVHVVFDALKSATDQQKIKAFDAIADSIAQAFRIDELDQGKQYLRSDADHYVFEDVIMAIMGGELWFSGFANEIYEYG